jgi:hypothetical protein
LSEDIDENVQILNLFLHLKEISKIKEKFLGTILLLLSIVEFEKKTNVFAIVYRKISKQISRKDGALRIYHLKCTND